MAARQVALDHYRDRRRLAQAVVAEARRLWGQIDPARIRQSWLELVARLVVVVTGAQLVAAQQAERYLDDVLGEQGVPAAAEGVLVASALSGVASDGLPLYTLLTQPAITAVTALDRGKSTREALAAGSATLEMMVRTQVADAGRVADGVALTARIRASGYVRMVVGATCSRCIILAGRWYRWNAGFQRHPRCDCIHIPAAEDTADEIATDPKKVFESMTPEEQDRVFGKAGAQAIRDGANMSQVVNARRGMYTASVGRRQILATTEGTTVRGLFGGYEIGDDGRLRRRGEPELERRRSGSRFIRAARVPRLMPEQIYLEAKGDRAEAIRLLRRFGYLSL